MAAATGGEARSATHPSSAPRRFLSPGAWNRRLSAPPVVTGVNSARGALIRRWRDVDPEISQPALDHHYLTIHLGGAKRLHRSGEGKREDVTVASGAISVVPAGSSFHWNTKGPIDFAHLYLAPRKFAELGIQEFGVDGLVLQDRLGVRDPLIAELFLAVLDEAAAPTMNSALYVDTLLHTLTVRLLRRYADAPARAVNLRHSLPPARLRRVLEFVEAHLAGDIALADLAAVASTSPFHFNRAFASATGLPPYAYLVRQRIERAKLLLADGREPVAIIAGQCGFHSPGQLARMFKQVTGQSPLRYRQDRS